jgi:hypothetical protein
MARLSLFLGAFAIACAGLTFIFYNPASLIDEGLWAHQAEWVSQGALEEFDLRKAYGHPGGPLIEASIALHALGLPYETALALFEVVAGALLIAGVVTLAYLLRGSALWSAGALGVLLLDPIYLDSSPPSYLATLLGAFLALYTLWLYERREEPAARVLLLWSAAAGALAATRADIGGVLVVTFALLLWLRYGARLTASLLVLAFAAFFIFDPFMWFMPVAHVHDIFTKMAVHYTGSLVTGHDYVSGILSFAARALGAILLALLLMARRQLPLPPAFIVALLGATVLVCLILFTSGFDVTRYFMPLIFIWELFLPLFLVTMITGPVGRGAVVMAPSRLGQIFAAGAVALIVVAPATVSLYFLGQNAQHLSPQEFVRPVPKSLTTAP